MLVFILYANDNISISQSKKEGGRLSERSNDFLLPFCTELIFGT